MGRVPARRLRAAMQATQLPTRDVARTPSEPGAIAWMPAPGWLAEGERVYAVGDIHGCADQLAALHRMIEEDAGRRPTGSPLLVHLGDYINGGPDSAAVLDRIAQPPPPPLRAVNLAGDNEQMLLDALAGDRAAATDWLEAGGASALRSWRIDPATPREQWGGLIPPAHLALLRSLVLSHRAGEYLFVHAGLRPGVPVAQQTRDDMQRIRQPFLSTEQDLGPIVVHGHSSSVGPVIARNRVGIDTGAGIGGPLTCAVLEQDRVGFLSAWPGASMPAAGRGKP